MLWVGTQTGAATADDRVEAPQKRKPELPYDPTVPLLGVYLKGLKSRSQTKIRLPMFAAPLFTTAETWRRQKCPPADEWIKKIRYFLIREHCPLLSTFKITILQSTCIY